MRMNEGGGWFGGNIDEDFNEWRGGVHGLGVGWCLKELFPGSNKLGPIISQ